MRSNCRRSLCRLIHLMAALDIHALGDVRVTLSALLGHARTSISEILDFHPGSIVPLQASSEAAIPLLVNGVIIAHGEIVSLENGCLALEILDVATPRDSLGPGE